MTATVQGGAWLAAVDTHSLAARALGACAIAAGALLTFGFLTPYASAMIALGAAAAAGSLLPASPQPLSAGSLPLLLFIPVAAALVFLGPGALSVDARLFGRREIIIPHSEHSRR